MDYICLRRQPDGNLIVVPEPDVADQDLIVRTLPIETSEDHRVPPGETVKDFVASLDAKVHRST